MFFYDSNTTERINLINLKSFLCNSYKRNREKLMRESLQKIRELEAELAELDRRIAARESTRNRANAIPNYDVTSTASHNAAKNLMGTNVLSNHGQHHQGQSQRSAPPKPAPI